MLQRILSAAAVALTIAACQAATPQSSEPATAKSGTTQPDKIPGQWALGDPALPELESIVKNAKHNERIYGLYTWTGEYRTHRASIQKVGFRAIRCGGPFDDEAMKLFAEDDMEVMATLGKPKNSTVKAGVSAEQDAKFIEDYQKHVGDFAGRYGPKGAFFSENKNVPHRPIRHVEIWNEPNFQYMIAPDGRPNKEMEDAREKLYAKLLPAAYTAIKAKSPDVNVVGFAAGGSGAGDLRFIDRVHTANPNVAKHYDILSTHPYVDPAPPEAYAIHSWGRYSIASSLQKIRKILAPHGRENTEIWYTEMGWAVSHQDGGFFPTKGVQVTPDLQAAYIVRNYALAMRLGVPRVHVMFATDTDTYNAGFFLRDGSWRPSAKAARTMTHLMPAPKLIGAVSDGTDGFFAYRFSPSATPKAPEVIMCWNVAGPKVVEIPVETPNATVTDMVGNAQKVQASKGSVRVVAGPLPVYVVGAP